MFSLVLSIFTRYIMTEGKELALLTEESISDIQENTVVNMTLRCTMERKGNGRKSNAICLKEQLFPVAK